MPKLPRVGDTFSSYTVTGEPFNRDGIWFAPCTCVCGTAREVRTGNLFNGNSKSCGCLKKKVLAELRRLPEIPKGTVFERLTVVTESFIKGRAFVYSCDCECGNSVDVRGSSLLSGETKSCGCYNLDRVTKHGMEGSPTYKSWAAMKGRVNNLKDPSYSFYGGRGITYDARWEDFENFLADMGTRPPGKTLERIDNDGPYNKRNCVWATAREQANNRRTNRKITFQGRTQNLAEWARELNACPKTLKWRLQNWPLERALTEPVRPKQG